MKRLVATTGTMTLIALLASLAGCSTPKQQDTQMCDISSARSEMQIEVRWYDPNDPSGAVTRFEWREYGKYNNPDEGWVPHEGHPEESDKPYSYRETEDKGKIACDDKAASPVHEYSEKIFVKK